MKLKTLYFYILRKLIDKNIVIANIDVIHKGKLKTNKDFFSINSEIKFIK